MASINFELNELVEIIKKTTYVPKQVKNICCECNRIKLTICPGKLSPSFDVFLTYDKFYDGKIAFKIASKGPVKIIFSIVGALGFASDKKVCSLNKEKFTLDLNDYLKEKYDFIEVKDIVNSSSRFSIII